MVDEVKRDVYSVLHEVRTGHAMEAASTVEHLAGIVGMYRRPEEAAIVVQLYERGALGDTRAQARLVHELRHIVHDPSMALDLDLVRAEEEAEQRQYKH